MSSKFSVLNQNTPENGGNLKARQQAIFWQSLLNKYEQRNLELEEKQCKLQHRLEGLSCAMPAALLYRMNKKVDSTKVVSSLVKPQTTSKLLSVSQTCPCNPCSAQEEEVLLDNFSLGSAGSDYINNLCKSATHEKQIKCKMQELDYREQTPNTLGESNFSHTTQDVAQENKKVSEEVKAVKLELKHCLERVQVPLTNQLEHQRRKSQQLQNDLRLTSTTIAKKQVSHIQDIGALQTRLNCTCETLCNVKSTNKQLNREMCILQCKYNELQKDIVRQKLSEAHTLRRLGEAVCMKQAMGDHKEIGVETKSSCEVFENASLETLAKKLSRTLLEIENCTQCKKQLPEDLKETVRYIKYLLELIYKNSSKIKKRLSAASKSLPPSPEEPPTEPQYDLHITQSTTTSIHSRVDVSTQSPKGTITIDIETETEVRVSSSALSVKLLTREPSVISVEIHSSSKTSSVKELPQLETTSIVSSKTASKEPSLQSLASSKVPSEKSSQHEAPPSTLTTKLASDEISILSTIPSKIQSIIKYSSNPTLRERTSSIITPAIHSLSASPALQVFSKSQVSEISLKKEKTMDVEVEVDTQGELYGDINIITTRTESGNLEVRTEGPGAVIDSTVTHTESGNIHITTEVIKFTDEDAFDRLSETGLEITMSSSFVTISSTSQLPIEGSLTSFVGTSKDEIISEEVTRSEESVTDVEEDESKISISESESEASTESEETEEAVEVTTEVITEETPEEATEETAKDAIEETTELQVEIETEETESFTFEVEIEAVSAEDESNKTKTSEGELETLAIQETQSELGSETATSEELQFEDDADEGELEALQEQPQPELGSETMTSEELQFEVVAAEFKSQGDTGELETLEIQEQTKSKLEIEEIKSEELQLEVVAPEFQPEGLSEGESETPEVEVSETKSETEAPTKQDGDNIRCKDVCRQQYEEEPIFTESSFEECKDVCRQFYKKETDSEKSVSSELLSPGPKVEEPKLENEAPEEQFKITVEVESKLPVIQRKHVSFHGLDVKVQIIEDLEWQEMTIEGLDELFEMEELRALRHESISEEPFTVENSEDDLRKSIEEAINKASQEVMGAMSLVNKNVIDALEKANRDVETALAFIVQETASKANKQVATEGEEFLEQSEISELVSQSKQAVIEGEEFLERSEISGLVSYTQTLTESIAKGQKTEATSKTDLLDHEEDLTEIDIDEEDVHLRRYYSWPIDRSPSLGLEYFGGLYKEEANPDIPRIPRFTTKSPARTGEFACNDVCGRMSRQQKPTPDVKKSSEDFTISLDETELEKFTEASKQMEEIISSRPAEIPPPSLLPETVTEEEEKTLVSSLSAEPDLSSQNQAGVAGDKIIEDSEVTTETAKSFMEANKVSESGERRISQSEGVLSHSKSHSFRSSRESRSASNESRRESLQSRRKSGESRRESPELRRESPQARRESRESRKKSQELKRESLELRRESRKSRRESRESRRELEKLRGEYKDKFEESISTTTPSERRETEEVFRQSVTSDQIPTTDRKRTRSSSEKKRESRSSRRSTRKSDAKSKRSIEREGSFKPQLSQFIEQTPKLFEFEGDHKPFRSKLANITCDCKECDCEICSPEKMKEKKKKSLKNPPEDCTCLPECYCPVCSLSLPNLKVSEEIKQPQGEYIVDQETPNQLPQNEDVVNRATQLLDHVQLVCEEHRHPENCDCLECLCNPCTFTKLEPWHPEQCDCLLCRCCTCGKTSSKCLYEQVCIKENLSSITQIAQTSTISDVISVSQTDSTGESLSKKVSIIQINYSSTNIQGLSMSQTLSTGLISEYNSIPLPHPQNCNCVECECSSLTGKLKHPDNCDCSQSLQLNQEETQKIESTSLKTASETNKPKQAITELEEKIKQTSCAYQIAEVKAVISSSLEQSYVAKQKSSFHLTMSGLKLALSTLQSKCNRKDQMIATMTKELKVRADSEVFNNMLHELATQENTDDPIDYDRTEICNSLPRPICDPQYGKPSTQLKEPLECRPCSHPNYPNCPCKTKAKKPQVPDVSIIQIKEPVTLEETSASEQSPQTSKSEKSSLIEVEKPPKCTKALHKSECPRKSKSKSRNTIKPKSEKSLSQPKTTQISGTTTASDPVCRKSNYPCSKHTHKKSHLVEEQKKPPCHKHGMSNEYSKQLKHGAQTTLGDSDIVKTTTNSSKTGKQPKYYSKDDKTKDSMKTKQPALQNSNAPCSKHLHKGTHLAREEIQLIKKPVRFKNCACAKHTKKQKALPPENVLHCPKHAEDKVTEKFDNSLQEVKHNSI